MAYEPPIDREAIERRNRRRLADFEHKLRSDRRIDIEAHERANTVEDDAALLRSHKRACETELEQMKREGAAAEAEFRRKLIAKGHTS